MGNCSDMVDTVGIDKDKAYCAILADIDCIMLLIAAENKPERK